MLERKEQGGGQDPYGRHLSSPIPSPLPQTAGGERVPAPTLPPGGVPPYLRPIPVNERDILATFREHLNEAEPRVMRQLYSTWNAQRDAIKDQEIRNALRDGEFSPQTWRALREEYATFVNERLAPRWRDMQTTGAATISRSLERFHGRSVPFARFMNRTERWIDSRGAELVVAISDNQRRALQETIRHFSLTEPVPPDELGRMLRPIVGLTPRQAQAVRAYRSRLVEQGLPRRRVLHLTGNYGLRLRRLRAETIARTEMAYAFNYGGFHAMQAAQERGDFTGEVVKEWATADDERVCDFCGPMDGQVLNLAEVYPAVTSRVPVTYVPPAHPRCRCSVVYHVVGGLEDAIDAGEEPGPPEPPPPPPDPWEGDQSLQVALTHPQRIRPGGQGVGVWRDEGLIDNHHVQFWTQRTGAQMARFDLASDEIADQVRRGLHERGATRRGMPYHRGEDPTDVQAVWDGEPVRAQQWRHPNGTWVRVMDDNRRVQGEMAHRAWRNRVELEFEPGLAPLDVRRRWNEVMDTLGIPSGAPSAEATEELALARFRMLWSSSTAQSQRGIKRGVFNRPTLANMSDGFSEEVLADATHVNLGMANSTLYSRPLAERLIRDADADFLYHDMSDADRLVLILTGEQPGLMATTRRYGHGVFTTGMSSQADLRTGGADSVFTRLASRSQSRHRQARYGARAIIDKRELGRMDHYAFENDRYGNTQDRTVPYRTFIDPGRYGTGWSSQSRGDTNEIMFPRTIPATHWRGALVRDEATRQRILQELRDKGVTHIGRRPIEQFVRTNFDDLPAGSQYFGEPDDD